MLLWLCAEGNRSVRSMSKRVILLTIQRRLMLMKAKYKVKLIKILVRAVVDVVVAVIAASIVKK